MTHHTHRNPRRVARRAARAAEGREGADPPERRPRPTAARAAVGAGRQGLPLRHRGRRGHARRPVPRPFAADRVPLHVRARLGRRLPELLGGRRRLRRDAPPPPEPRRRVHRGLACTARRSCSPTASGWGGASRGRRRRRSDFNFDFNVSFTEESVAHGQSYNFRAARRLAGSIPRTCRSRVRA